MNWVTWKIFAECLKQTFENESVSYVSHVQLFFDHIICSPPGSSVHGILQARILEWVAIPFCKGSSWPGDQIQVSCITGRFFTIWAPRGAPKPLKVLRECVISLVLSLCSKNLKWWMDQCYCSVLLGKTKDNTYSRSEGGPTQKTKRREAPILLSFLLLCIYLLPWSLSYVNWASQEGCLFYLCDPIDGSPRGSPIPGIL